MKALIEKLEAGTEGSRGLDAEIFAQVCSVADIFSYGLAAGVTTKIEPQDDGSVKLFATAPGSEPHYMARKAAPHYSTSLDAALSLVPEGWEWRLVSGGRYATGKRLLPRAELAEPIETQFGPGVGIRAQCDGETPAIAVCIASLLARKP